MSVSWTGRASCFALGTRALFYQAADPAIAKKMGQVGQVGISHLRAVEGRVATRFFRQDKYTQCHKMLECLHSSRQKLEMQRNFYFGLLTAPEEHININAHEDPAFIAGRLAETRGELDQIVRDIASLNKCVKYFSLQNKLLAMEGRVASVLDRIAKRYRD